jgi:ribosomal protein S18 acetylase RimI-like enzyme
MRLHSWTPALEAPFVRFWNRCFSDHRHAIRLTREELRRRVTEGGVPGERFDPARFIVAREGGRIAGFVHVSRRSAAACRRADPTWSGGALGVVCFLFVDPARRRRGIGDRLWHAGVGLLKGCSQVVLDGACLNPFWGNAQGPRPPFWGSPEGVGVSWDDGASKKFFARKGFAPRFRGIQLSLDLAGASLPPAVEASFVPRMPVVGGSWGTWRRTHGAAAFETAVALSRRRVRGMITYFPWTGAREGLYGIYAAAVVRGARGGSLGRGLLGAALRRIAESGGRSVEVLTVPELGEAAHRIYLEAGFRQAASWALY